MDESFLALSHNYGAYEDSQRQVQPPELTRNDQAYYEQKLKLVNDERIEFARVMKGVGKFILFMSLSGGAVFISRILPIFSFAGFSVRVLTFCFLGKEAVFNPSEKERRDFGLLLLSVGLGNLGAEWDAWLAISSAISDFFTLYGTAIFGGLGIVLVVIVWLLFRWTQHNQQTGNLNAYNNYNTIEADSNDD